MVNKKWLTRIIDTIAITVILFICCGRFYLGRHSVDQIIFGAALGFATAIFFNFFFKPRLFDPFFRKENISHDVITQSSHWTSAKIATLVSSIMAIECFAIYYYVDNYVTIP